MIARLSTIGPGEAGKPWRGGKTAAEGDEVWRFISNSPFWHYEGIALVRKGEPIDGIAEEAILY